METRSGTICLWHSHRLDQGFWFWAAKTSSVGGSSCAGCFCLPCTAHALPWACSVSYTGFLSCQRILLNSWCHQRFLQPHSFHCEPPAMLIGYSHEHPPNWEKRYTLRSWHAINLLFICNPRTEWCYRIMQHSLWECVHLSTLCIIL